MRGLDHVSECSGSLQAGSHDALQLADRGLEPIVDDDVAELGLGLELVQAVGRRRSTSSAASVPRPTRRSRRASTEGGAMKTCSASGMASRIWRAPWTSISSTTGTPAAVRRASSDRRVP